MSLPVLSIFRLLFTNMISILAGQELPVLESLGINMGAKVRRERQKEKHLDREVGRVMLSSRL